MWNLFIDTHEPTHDLFIIGNTGRLCICLKVNLKCTNHASSTKYEIQNIYLSIVFPHHLFNFP